MPGHIAWLEAECREGMVRQAGRPAARSDGKQESEPSYYRKIEEQTMAKRLGNWRHAGGRTLEPKLMQRRSGKRGKQSRAEGREAGKWMREGREEREHERNGGSARKGYTS